jgi:hypothetical protein
MCCKKIWGYDILYKLFPISFVNKEITKHKGDIIFNMERKYIPITQATIVKVNEKKLMLKKKRELKETEKVITDKISKLENLGRRVDELQRLVDELENIMDEASDNLYNDESTDEYKFSSFNCTFFDAYSYTNDLKRLKETKLERNRLILSYNKKLSKYDDKLHGIEINLENIGDYIKQDLPGNSITFIQCSNVVNNLTFDKKAEDDNKIMVLVSSDTLIKNFQDEIKKYNDDNVEKTTEDKVEGVTEKVEGVTEKVDNDIKNTESIKDIKIIEDTKNISQSTENCKGYVNINGYCSICFRYTCTKCFELLPVDSKNDHVCSSDILKNIEVARSNTRPCPKCSEIIYKIDGCDQMWCVKCHTPFSWETGEIDKGKIHNPDYFRWMRENNIVVENNNEIPDDDLYIFNGRMFKILIDRCLNKDIEEIKNIENIKGEEINRSDIFMILERSYRTIPHYRDVIKTMMNTQEEENEDLRRKYLNGKLTDEQFKKRLGVRNRCFEKKREVKQYYTTFCDSAKDIYNKFLIDSNDTMNNLELNIKPIDVIKEFVTSINNLIDNINTNIKDMLTSYGMERDTRSLIKIVD